MLLQSISTLCISGSPIVGQMFFRATLFTSYYQVKAVSLCIVYSTNVPYVLTPVCIHTRKSDAKIEITITTTNLIRIKYPLSSFNYRLSGADIANFNKIHCTVPEQQLFKKRNSKTEVSNMEK